MRHLYPLSIFLLLCMPFDVRGKHIIGGVLTYECLGGGKYRFLMKMYRDCAGGGANFDNAAPFSIYKGDAPHPLTTIIRGPSMIRSIDPPDNPCLQVPPGVCVEEGIYVFEYTFADWPSNESYTISYQRCCRNEGVTNIKTPGAIGATFTIELTPEAQAVCNNSPVYNTFPPIVICANEPLSYDHSAFDPDGDQLIYELCAPLKGGGLGGLQGQGNADDCDGITPTPACPPPYEEVEFINPPYSPLNPMGGAPPVTIDPVTGLLHGTPVTTGQFSVGICIKEYRNGVLLSVVRRDFQFNVTSCTPLVEARVAGPNVQYKGGRYHAVSCGGTTVHLDNVSIGASFVDEVIWEFPLANTILRSSDWDLDMDFPGPGHYEGSLFLNPSTQGCSDSTRIAIDIFPEIHPDFSYSYDTCVAGPVVFQNESFIDLGQDIAAWAWDFGDGTTDSVHYNPSHLYSDPGVHPVKLTVWDHNGCWRETTRQVSYQPVPALILVRPNDTVTCVPASVWFNNLSTPIDETYHIRWDFGDGSTSDQISPAHAFQRPGTYDVRLEITSPIGCYTDTVFSQLVRVEPAPVANFDIEPDTFDRFNREATFIDLSENAVHWDWYVNGRLVAQAPIVEYTFPDTGLQEVMLVITHPQYCLDTMVKVVDVVPTTTFWVPSAFTPNEDTVNDFFRGAGVMDGVRNFRMLVFDRWGNVIFEADDPQDAWNGLYQNEGRQVPAGVYPYVATWIDPRGRPGELRGFVTLIR